ncbi:MAG: hypothetical protein QFB87_01000 [Patescibacteria group bacterium]|nr:hypothetical protein [Patescibacteria group bacterium]
MSTSPQQPNYEQPGLFEVGTTVSFGLTDPSAQPHITHTFLPAANAPNVAPATAAIPTVVTAEPGVSVPVSDRALVLEEFVIPAIAGIGQREALQDAMFTDDAPELSQRKVERAAENAKDMERSAWNLLYRTLGYEAAAAAGVGDPTSGKRLVSEDLQRLKAQYGRGKPKERSAFLKILKTQRH